MFDQGGEHLVDGEDFERILRGRSGSDVKERRG